MITDINGLQCDIDDRVVCATGSGSLYTGVITRITKTRVSVLKDAQFCPVPNSYGSRFAILVKYNDKAEVMKL